MLDGKPFQIISGEMHPARVPKAYWRHRIQMIKAMGCNTVAAYIFWNYHEVSKGKFDFNTENRNMAEFVQLCQEEGMWVLFRPGPYVCAEWDFGGLPTYLLQIPDIKIRCMDTRYMAAVQRYVTAMAAHVRHLQISKGGPILMWQVENEYGSYGNDRTYMQTLASMWRKAGIDVPFYTADGPTPYMLEAGSLIDAAIGLDSGSDSAAFAQATRQNPNVPSFSSETYPGWLTHWGEKWARPDTAALKKEVSFLLANKKSFNFYVIHGGTNFGYTAGANAFSPSQYQPDLTSYDYDAPIDESGNATPKYHMLRRLIEQYTGKPAPPIPAPVKHISIPSFSMQPAHSLFDYAPKVHASAQPQPMEYYGQNQGFIVYRTKLIGHKSGRLKIWEPHDYALVYLDGQFIDTVYRDGGNWEVQLPKTNSATPELTIVVEGMGHINFAQFMIDRKGITDRVTLNGMTLMNWQTQLLPVDEAFMQQPFPKAVSATKQNGDLRFFTGEFSLTETGDTYLDLSGYSKGVVFVNGRLLGRYWNLGPQYRLYCPATWLKKGQNKIVVMDLHQSTAAAITGFTSML
ncbi:glycoside hydrolase family 35 protein [Phnomibacter ginsenosidimutans]|uniref:glycoside hydrolase family 35 protein n=1 Tax=Phnomibacter ginsenosidimutans TaxID=2676868 RepID=UPI001FE74FC2|nr:beta-galactosidase [Phnomibacter ginsenosidimutans]